MKKLIDKTKRQALVIIEKAFVKHGILEIECNGTLTPNNVIRYLKKRHYDFDYELDNEYLVRLISNVDLPYIYAETV